MDDEYRKILDLIEDTVHLLSIDQKGLQLLHVAKDYVEDLDLLNARRVLNKIEEDYFVTWLPRQIVYDGLLADTLAVLIDAFGVDFYLVSHPAGNA